MAFSINTNSLVNLISFERAREYYNKNTPVGDRTKERSGVPLHWDRKSADSYSLQKVYRGPKGIEAYACTFHNTACVTFLKNGDIELDASWDSASTRLFVEHYAPWLLILRASKGYTTWSFAVTDLCKRQRDKYTKLYGEEVGMSHVNFIIKGDELTLKKQKSGWAIPESSIVKMKSLTINRKKSKREHNKFEGFLAMVKFYEAYPMAHETRIKLLRADYYTEYALYNLVRRWPVDDSEWIKYIAEQGHTPYQTVRANLFQTINELGKCYNKTPVKWGSLPSDLNRAEWGK